MLPFCIVAGGGESTLCRPGGAVLPKKKKKGKIPPEKFRKGLRGTILTFNLGNRVESENGTAIK